MKASASPLCEATCAIRGRHIPDCPDIDACRGCQPRQASDGLHICSLHAERIVEDALEAPRLYADLGLVLVRRGQDGERMSGSSAGAPVPDDEVMDARGAIRQVLMRLTNVIATERGVKPPTVVRSGQTYVDTRAEALGAMVSTHAEWLAAHRRAGTYADLLHQVTRGKVRKLAYPSISDRLYIGECPLVVRDIDGVEHVCGTRLYQLPDNPLISCMGCGTDETVEQWQKWIVGDTGGVSDAYAVASHLALKWMRPVDPALIRKWSQRGHINPVMAADPKPSDPDNVSRVRDGKNRTQYVISEVVQYAESIWGPPYRPMRRSG